MFIEVNPELDEEVSTISSSLEKVATKQGGERFILPFHEEGEEKGHGGVGDEKRGEVDDATEDDDNGVVEETDDEEVGDHEDSEVDSRAVSLDDDEESVESDSTFFERLMTDMLDVQSQLDGRGGDGVEDWASSEPSQNLRRSMRTIKAPQRLIEEMSGLGADGLNDCRNWSECLALVHEAAMVGAGIGGGFTHTSELNVKN